MFPSIINTFNIVSPTDRLNSPSHSALHNSVSSVVTQMQTVIGTESSALGTIIYDLRSPDSNGGGHVQSANKGGTGQTTYNKGDLLVATSSSVITKLAVSSTAGEVLVSDPNQAAGMKWANTVANKVSITPSSVFVTAGGGSVVNVLYATSIAGSILGDNNAIRFTGQIRNFSSDKSFTLVANYGNNIVASVVLTYESGIGNSIIGAIGTIDGMIISRGSSSTQLGYIKTDISKPIFGATNTKGPAIANGTGSGNSSVNSSATQNLVITGIFNGVGQTSIMAGFLVVEKIS